MNPMGKEHMLRGRGVDGGGRGETASSALSGARALPVGAVARRLVIADDVAGGWTNRTRRLRAPVRVGAFVHARFRGRIALGDELPSRRPRGGGIVGSVSRVLGADARRARTLRQMVAQEHAAMLFAGMMRAPCRRGFLDAADAPTLFACLYGDAAASSLGYTPLGVVLAFERFFQRRDVELHHLHHRRRSRAFDRAGSLSCIISSSLVGTICHGGRTGR